MPKTFSLSLVIASVAAALLAMVSDRRGFEELIERAAIAEQANMPGTKCPLSREYIDKADIGLLSICLRHGLRAYEAAQRYPASAAKVFAVYGEEETFQRVFDQYGHEVIPIVAFFVENGSLDFQIRQTVGEAWQQLWAGQTPKWQLAKLTREQIGLIAIDHVAARGHEMLAEFEIVDGVAKRKPVTRFILGAKDLLFGGIGDLEKILVRGERLTTNFDTALPMALNERRPHIPHIAEVNRGPDDFREFGIFNRAQIVWLHGKAEQYTDRNSTGEIEKLDRKLVEQLVPLLANSPLIVIGYRGSESSVMDHLLAKNAKRAQDFKHGIFWCVRHGEAVHPNVAALQRAIGGNFRLLEITGFDEVMEDQARELANEDLYPNARAAERGAGAVAFDDREVASAHFDDLDHDLMLTVMREYCAKLGRAPVTRDTLPGLLREQGFLVKIGDNEVPTAGCILLFGKNPQQYFPHAVISATITGKKRTVFDGNLIGQRLALLEWLASEDINPLLKVKRRTTHDAAPAYPGRALVELVINQLVHRDYERSETASIDVEPGRAITFKNPGGLSESVVNRVKPDDAGRFRAVPNVSDLRNRSLCDVFFGIRAMEREGTGLSDVEELAREQGGDTAFTHEAKTHSFTARILQPVASAGSRTIARDDRPVGMYVFNVLPFASLPERVSIARLRVPWEDRPVHMPLSEAGTFVLHDGALWSFVPLSILGSVLAPMVDVEASHAPLRSVIEDDPEQRKILSWLLRKHFERHLVRFRKHGLMIEEGRRKGRRAYFEGHDGKPRRLVYDTPHRKGVRREVVKQRREDARAWFENEGFGFEVTQLDGLWAVRIKPFYMFTGRDAKTPLPAFARTSRATRRMKLDRNKNVDDDLTFWGRWLSEGAPTINIGQDHVDDLILEGTFLTIEVPEEGLLRDSDEGEDRMPA